MVVPEYQISRAGKNPLRVDAAVLDAFNLPRGYWEAKDEKDDLKAEMNKKFAAGTRERTFSFRLRRGYLGSGWADCLRRRDYDR